MRIDRYIEIRNCQKEFAYSILDFEIEDGSLKRAGKTLGFLEGETLYFDDEEESNILMEYILFEKNGKKNRLIDRYHTSCFSELSTTEQMILEGMQNSIYSIYKVIECKPERSSSKIYDLVGKKEYELIDINMSQSASVGLLLATRLVPIEDMYITSGLIFAFEPQRQLRLLTEISKSRPKKRKISIKPKKSTSKTLLEIMHDANKKWGMEVKMS